MTVYLPQKPNDIALLVTSGGAYKRVVLDKEGSDFAPQFNARGNNPIAQQIKRYSPAVRRLPLATKFPPPR